MKLLVALINILLFCSINYAAVNADAGVDKVVFVNQTVVLDGSNSTDAFDGWRPTNVSPDHAIKWEYGYGGFQRHGSLIGAVSFPVAGVFTATLTVCDSLDNCDSDTALITVNNIPPCTSEIIFTDTGNPSINMANLQTEVNNSVGSANRCVTIPNGAVLRGQLIPTHRTSTTFITIRSAGAINLPSSRRVALSDSPNMFFMENSISGANNLAAPIIETPATSNNPARFYNFVGIYFRKAIPTAEYMGLAMVNIGKNNETSLAQLPNNIILDRCVIDGSTSTTNSWRGFLLTANDSALVNSYICGFKGVALETQAVLMGQGERNTFMNNFMEGATENFLIGGLDISITNHIPSYISFRRNYLKKNLIWCAVCGQYSGIDYSVKNIWEAKVGRYIENEGNIYENHWIEDQSQAIVITVRNSGIGSESGNGNDTWANIQFLDFSYNKIKNMGNMVQILGKDNLNLSQRIDHINIRQSIFSGVARWNGQKLGFVITSAGNSGADRISIRQTSSDINASLGSGQGRWIEFDGNQNFTNCDFSGNIAQGFINFGPQTGDSALQLACSTNSYSATKNGLYTSTGVNPSGNTIVATIADVKFLDILNGNLALASDSPFLTTGLANLRSGADVARVNIMTLGAESGIWPNQCNWHTNPACN